MKPIFALQPIRKSIFLAGPTPRAPKPSRPPDQSWRPEALTILEAYGFDGDVFVPETSDWLSHDNYDRQVRWEWEALNQATVIAFWVPREIFAKDADTPTLKFPAFTTNVEFGLYARSGKALLGYPPGAEKMSYLDALARECKMSVYANVKLETFLAAAVLQARR